MPDRIHNTHPVRAWLVLALVAAMSLSGGTALAAASSAGNSAKRFAAQPVTGVFLIDESGSETPASVRAEAHAAIALIDADPSPASQYMIAGFGSENRPGQQAVTPYCSFITTSSASARASLATCAQHARPRTAAEGWDTDDAQALEFALGELKGRSGLKTIDLLTDGVLDVHDSPIYGRLASQRTPEALRIIDSQLLPEARHAGVQIWPLGFGPDASLADLERFALGGGSADSRCGGSDATPHAVVVKDISSVAYNLVSDLTAARCGAVGPPVRGSVSAGGSTTLRVRIPPIADYGSLTVVTETPGIHVVFIDPAGDRVPDQGSADGQEFASTGIGTDVQTLRIVDPVPGEWRIVLSAPRQARARANVVGFASWEGVLSTSLFASPLKAIPGQPVDVALHVLSRGGVLAGAALASVHATAVIRGSFGQVTVPLHLAQGAFAGQVRLPRGAKGDVAVTARITAPGATGDQSSETIGVQSSNFLSSTVSLKTPTTLTPGAVVHGEVTTINQGPATRGALRLGDFSPGALVTISAPALSIPTGTASVPFSIRISPRTPLGHGFVSVVLDGADGTPISASQVDLFVVAPRSWWTAHRAWIIATAVALLLLLGVALARGRVVRARRTRDADTEGITATLFRDGIPVGPTLSSEGGPEFGLQLVGEELVHRDVGLIGVPIAIRRAGHAVVVGVGVDEPRRYQMGQSLPLEGDLALLVDEPHPELHLDDHLSAAVAADQITTPDQVPDAGTWR